MNNQKGYVIQIVLIVFAIIIGLMIFPVKFPKLITKDCRVGLEVDPLKESSIMLPPIKNVGLKGGTDTFPGGWDESSPNAEYVLIRKNVPIFAFSNDPAMHIGFPDYVGKDVDETIYWPIIADTDFLGVHADTRHTLKYEAANQAGFAVYYPNEGGEMDLPKTITDRTGRSISWLTIRTEGILLFVHLGPDGKAVKLNNGQNIYYLVDFYQDKKLYEASNKGYEIDDLFHCLDKRAPAQPGVVEPDQKKSATRDQLQLQWFLFEGAPGMAAHCKPAIYLYPPKKELVNVKVTPSGFLTYTDPPYDPGKGWNVEANPDGTLFTMNDERLTNNYLYFESKIRDDVIQKPTKGWVVKFDELDTLYQNILPKLGLNPKQTQDFREYWNKALHPAPYYFVGVIDQDNVDQIERLDITPKPDSVNRVRIYFERLDSPKIMEAPDLSSFDIGHLAFGIGNSFKVVEWGGMVKNDKDHPFTCSQ